MFSIDTAIIEFDKLIKNIFARSLTPARPSPAKNIPEASLTLTEKKQIAALMRVDHTGEVCAQALYQGQALTARSNDTKQAMKQAAIEENDHLAWCTERLEQLGDHQSVLNPLWYGGSFTMGVVAGLIGDDVNLGFLAETERQVVKHLNDHLEKIPEHDLKSRAILSQMKIDEAQHATTAINHGAKELPNFVKGLMACTSKIMTTIAARI